MKKSSTVKWIYIGLLLLVFSGFTYAGLRGHAYFFINQHVTRVHGAPILLHK
jgi:hypothetical protein